MYEWMYFLHIALFVKVALILSIVCRLIRNIYKRFRCVGSGTRFSSVVCDIIGKTKKARSTTGNKYKDIHVCILSKHFCCHVNKLVQESSYFRSFCKHHSFSTSRKQIACTAKCILLKFWYFQAQITESRLINKVKQACNALLQLTCHFSM